MKVSIDDLLLGAEWLDHNEGTDGEAEGCHRAAEFLRREAQRREFNDTYRKVARQAGVSVKVARAKVREIAGWRQV